MLKTPCLNVQFLQYNFLDQKFPISTIVMLQTVAIYLSNLLIQLCKHQRCINGAISQVCIHQYREIPRHPRHPILTGHFTPEFTPEVIAK